MGTWAHWQKHTTCASAFTMCQQLSRILLCEKKKHPRHTNWLMSRSISCCMKLKMASGRRSIVYLLRGHASAFLCHSKKKNIYCNAASSSVKWTPMEFTSSDSQQQTNKHSNNVISPNETHFKQCSVRKLISNPYAQCI